LKKGFNKELVRVLIGALIFFFLCACSFSSSDIFSNGVGLPASTIWITQIVILFSMILGLVGLLFVIIPGLTIIWISALIYGILTDFDTLSIILFVLISALMLLGNVLDQLLMGAKAKKSGASWSSIIISTGAAFIFSILFPPFGGLIAALIALMVLEIIRLKDWRKAAHSSKEMAIGCLSAIALRFLIGLVMIGIWMFWAAQSAGSIFSP
jgi:uncharacterized protein YqgC (DUF456 family)